jgi:hypothetical protein
MSSHSTLDFSVLSHASESTPVKTSESLQDELQAVNRELGSMKRKWQEERQQLLGDNAVLKDAANRLNLEVQDVKERAEKKERKHEKARNGVLGVCFPFSSVGMLRSLYCMEFTGAGRGEADDSGPGRGSQGRAHSPASPHARADPRGEGEGERLAPAEEERVGYGRREAATPTCQAQQ